MTSKDLQPAAVVDYALALAARRELKVHKIGTFAEWKPALLCRAHNEAVDRDNLGAAYGLSWNEKHLYRGVIHALSLAHDNAVAGPRRRRAA